MVDTAGLLNTALGSLPAIIALFRKNHADQHPGAPPLTDADVFGALKSAVDSTIAKDDALAADIRRRNPDL